MFDLPERTNSQASAMIFSKSFFVDMSLSSWSLFVTKRLISRAPPRPPRPLKSPTLDQSQSFPDLRILSIAAESNLF